MDEEITDQEISYASMVGRESQVNPDLSAKPVLQVLKLIQHAYVLSGW
jgi:hypothetical protein